jgi:haloacetate dehalogenase
VFDVLATWQERASIVTGKQVATGHFIAEERPDILLAELNSFLG